MTHSLDNSDITFLYLQELTNIQWESGCRHCTICQFSPHASHFSVCVCVRFKKLEGLRDFHAVCLLILAQLNEQFAHLLCTFIFLFFLKKTVKFFCEVTLSNQAACSYFRILFLFFNFYSYYLLLKTKVDDCFCWCVLVCVSVTKIYQFFSPWF